MTTNNDVLRAVYDLHSEVHLTRAVAWAAVAGLVDWTPARVLCIVAMLNSIAKSFGAFVKGEEVER